jgi:hypothetical protein
LARECLPSYREPASLDPQAEHSAELLRTAQYPRTVSPSLHPCPASGRASGFLPASALTLHEALQPPGAEDARCVQPTSATQTNDVHPHIACSRLLEPLSRSGTPRGLRGSARHDRGSQTFHASENAWANRESSELIAAPSLRPRGLRTRTWALSSHGAGCDRHLTPLSRPLLVLAVRALSRWRPHVPLMDSGWTGGAEDEGAAKARIRADP